MDDVLDQLSEKQRREMVKKLASERRTVPTDMEAVLALIEEWAGDDDSDDERVLGELAASNAFGLSLRDTGA